MAGADMGECSSRKLLVVDDLPEVCELFAAIAASCGFEVRCATGFDEFAHVMQEFDPAIVLVDLQMPGRDGIELLRHLGACHSRAGVIITSGMGERVLVASQQIGRAHGLNMLGALQKPIAVEQLAALLTDPKVTQSVRAAMEA